MKREQIYRASASHKESRRRGNAGVGLRVSKILHLYIYNILGFAIVDNITATASPLQERSREIERSVREETNQGWDGGSGGGSCQGNAKAEVAKVWLEEARGLSVSSLRDGASEPLDGGFSRRLALQ